MRTWTKTLLILLWSTAAFALDYPHTVIADAPLIYWRLEENSRTTSTAYDSSGNGHHASYLGGGGLSVVRGQVPAFTTGCYSEINDAAGTQQRIELADFSGLQLGTGNWSIELWWQTASGQAQCSSIGDAVSKGDYHNWPAIECGWDGVDQGPQIRTASSLTGPAHLSHGVWHHIVLIRNSTTNIDWYIDNSLAASITVSSSLSVDTSDPLIAWFNNLAGNGGGDTTTYDLRMDEIAIYNFALSAGQVSSHYNARSNVLTIGCLGKNRIYQMN